eukprot:2211420-Pleurochrysis_carterae.AAC.1
MSAAPMVCLRGECALRKTHCSSQRLDRVSLCAISPPLAGARLTTSRPRGRAGISGIRREGQARGSR